MIYTPLTKLAMQIAYDAHHGQIDKSGTPYIFHPIHLAEQMDDEISCCAALLHDVVEDTQVTIEDLAVQFPPEVIRVLQLLTHKEGQDYFDYVRAIKSDPVAVRIKQADLRHNRDQSRFAGTNASVEKLLHWQEKYRKAAAILSDE